MGEVLKWAVVLGLIFGAGAAIFMLVAAGGARKANAENAEQRMDTLFDGSPQVIYKDALRAGLPLDTLITGANRRGYRFVSTIDDSKYMKSHIFERVSPEPRP